MKLQQLERKFHWYKILLQNFYHGKKKLLLQKQLSLQQKNLLSKTQSNFKQKGLLIFSAAALKRIRLNCFPKIFQKTCLIVPYHMNVLAEK